MAWLLQQAAPMIRRRRAAKRGYTLVELMIVIVIVGVLAALAVFGVSKYVFAAKTAEAFTMIGSIKAAQESYKDETFVYLDTTGDVEIYPQGSVENVGSTKYSWSGHDGEAPWRTLGVSTNNPVIYGYGCVAGGPTDAPPSSSVPEWDGSINFPTTPNRPWYVVYAVGDQNDNGVRAVFVGSSFTDQILAQRQEE